MLKTLKDLFDAVSPSRLAANPPLADTHALQLATAVLLVEVMRADAEMSEAERTAVLAALRTQFALQADEGDRLMELAHETSRQASDYFAYTSAINDAFDMPRKLQMVEWMWHVAYADGSLAAHENHVMWRLADLMHIPHGAYVHAKMRAQAAAGVAVGVGAGNTPGSAP